MEKEIELFEKRSLVLPDGSEVVIREQNGEDDDVLSNRVTSKTLMNFSEFISRIVIKCTITPNGLLTPEQAHELPSNVRYAILLASRSLSLGNEVEFSYNWGKENGGSVSYVQDINELLFDYLNPPTEEDLLQKPFAVPYYPLGSIRVIETCLPSGKEIRFNLLDGVGESFILNSPLEKKTKNTELIARNLELKVNGVYEKVTSFRLFNSKDMYELRKLVSENDPVWPGIIPIENPHNGESALVQLMGMPDFFYMGGY